MVRNLTQYKADSATESTSDNVTTSTVGKKSAASRPRLKMGRYSLDLTETMGELNHYTTGLIKLIESFWGIPVHCELFSLTTETPYFSQFHDNYVSQTGLEVRDPEIKGDLTLKLSSHLCAALLTTVLGSKNSNTKHSELFSLSTTSDYEKAILSEFNKDLLTHCVKAMTRQKNPDIPNSAMLHLTWAVLPNVAEYDAPDSYSSGNRSETGFITIQLPANALKIPQQISKQQAETLPINEAFFNHATVEACLWVGTTKVNLSDLKQLEPSDTIVLDDSRSNQLTLIHKGKKSGDEHRYTFPVSIRNSQNITLQVTKEMETMTQQTLPENKNESTQNLWDDLAIDVSAAFEPVKIPLKQLKDMSQGLVVEVGDIINNTVTLNVEGKVLAKGTLVIVDNKFGLRVEQMEAATIAGESIEASTAPPPPPAPEQAPLQTEIETPATIEANIPPDASANPVNTQAPPPPPPPPPADTDDDDDFDLDLDDLTSDLDDGDWT